MVASFPSNDGAKKRYQKHKQVIKDLSGRQVEAGWFESARYKAGKGVSEKQVGMSVAQIARINEFGTATIPARPMMRLASENFQRDRNEIQTKIGKKLIDGKITPDKALAQIGLAMEGKIVDSIKNGNWKPNADSTVASKGFNKPLIDTAQMFQTVASKVS
jgi:hypothetical protein